MINRVYFIGFLLNFCINFSKINFRNTLSVTNNNPNFLNQFENCFFKSIVWPLIIIKQMDIMHHGQKIIIGGF